MKTVIIPSDYHPFVIEVNGIKYTYPEGTEQSVPDEVASAIENYYKLQPKERPADGGVLPWVSDEDEGDVLKVEDGVWKKANGGLSESDFVLNGKDLTGFGAEGGAMYLPVFPDTGSRITRIGDGTGTAERATTLYVRRDAGSSSTSLTEVAYEKKGVRYVLSQAMILGLLMDGAAEESINIPVGAPAKLWDNITVAVNDAELYCRRYTPESYTTASYQGFISSKTSFGEGIYCLDIGVQKSGTYTYTFSLSLKKASGGGSSNHIHKINVLFNAVTFGPTGGTIDGDAKIMLSIPVDKAMTRDEFLQYLVDNGHSDSKPLWVLNSSDTSYIYETEGPCIWLLNILYVYYVNYGGVPTYIGAGGKAMKIDYRVTPVKYTKLNTNYFTKDLSGGFSDTLIS